MTKVITCIADHGELTRVEDAVQTQRQFRSANTSRKCDDRG
jgi:hypothetical protein